MALERLSLAPVLVESNKGEDMNKAPRLPRWTRQELLVLIQGKRVAENRVRRGRTAVVASSSSSSQSQVEPKWSSVSSYCKRHGVNRGPVQCRKRWSNLAGDFKKIKEWESQIKEEAESFWLMRNDLRRERKLPGFFDREVYDILDGGGGGASSDNKSLLLLSLAPSASNDDTPDIVFDSGRTATPEDGLFSPHEVLLPTTAPTPISATQYEPFSPPAATTQQEKSSIPNPHQEQEDQEQEEDQEEEEEEKEKEGLGRKRKRPATDINESSLQNQLIEAMERNGRLLASQLEIQNTNSHLDREQRKDHANTLFAVLNKLADAMVRIADKL